jgi:hypothetical protein
MEKLQQAMLAPGSVVHYHGVPVYLAGHSCILMNPENLKLFEFDQLYCIHPKESDNG